MGIHEIPRATMPQQHLTMAFTYALVGSRDVQWNPEQTHDFILPDSHSHGPQCSLDMGVR